MIFDAANPQDSYSYEYDARGNLTVDSTLHPDGELSESTRRDYDARNRLVFEGQQNSSGQLVWDTKRQRFNDRGRLVEEVLVLPESWGTPGEEDAAIWVQDFDDRGNLLERRAQNSSGEHVPDYWDIEHFGCATVRWSEYDERDRPHRVECLDTQGTVLMSADRGH